MTLLDMVKFIAKVYHDMSATNTIQNINLSLTTWLEADKEGP